jgi:arabinofuranosyltransferase
VRLKAHIIVALAVMLVFAGYFLWCEHRTSGTFGFPLDDSWIHAQFARNLALGHGFSYNPGVPASGSTAPLWTLVLSVGHLVTGDAILSGKVLGIAFLALTVVLVYALTGAITRDERQALFAAVVAGSLSRLVWAGLSGMEITLAVTLTLAGILAHVNYGRLGDRRQYLSTALFGLAALARPECAAFFVAAMLDRALSATLIRWRELAARDWLIPVILHVALFLAIIAPFLLFSRVFGVGFLPNTAYAKALLWGRGLIAALATGSLPELVRSFTVHPFDYYLSFLQESLSNNPILFVFSSFGFLSLVLSIPYAEESRCRTFIVPLSVIVFPLAIGVIVPFGTASYQEGRYAAPVAPLMIVIGTIGLYEAARYGARILSRAKFMGRPATVVMERSLIWLFMALALGAQFRTAWYRGKSYGREVANIEEMQVALGKWIDVELPADVTLAVNDVGAIAYFSERKVLDTVGLISPEVLTYIETIRPRDAAVLEFLEHERPEYAVLFPDWYPRMVAERGLFEPIHRVRLEDNIICGGDEMVVYALHWDRFDEGETRAERAADAGDHDPAFDGGTRVRLDR